VVEGVKVADAIILAYAREKTPFFPARTDGVIDIIPADLVANSLILAADRSAGDAGETPNISVFNRIGKSTHDRPDEAFAPVGNNRNAGAYERLYPKGTPKRDFRNY